MGVRLGILPDRLIGLNLAQRCVVAVGGVPQKNHAEHRHTVFDEVSLELARRLSAASHRSVSRCSMFWSWLPLILIRRWMILENAGILPYPRRAVSNLFASRSCAGPCN